MKKFIAIILSIAMILPMVLVPVTANETNTQTVIKTAENLDSVFAEGEDSLIVFVTGIGQSFSYLFDESYTKAGAFKNGTLQDYENYAPLIAEGKHSARWNLFNSFDEAFSNFETISAIAMVVISLILSAFTRNCIIDEADVQTIIRNLFHFNLVDESGNGDPRVVTPRYVMPVSEYPGVIREDGEYYSEAKDRFYSSIPCAEIAEAKLGENYEDYLYVFNYNAFSYTSKNVEGLHDFIETILADNKVGAKDVVLIPMSMGASVVTAYMSEYPTVAENHIRRVVSIVGAWDGSDVVADLLTQQYCDNSADLFYNGLIAELVGEPWGYLINIVLRLFPKQVLRDFIDMALAAIATEMFCATPSLCNLIPVDRYDEVSHLISSDVVKAEADKFQNAKKNLQATLASLENEGVTFSYISGYGLPFGAITSDYRMFGFMKNAPITNSDEIINIDSTAPGTSFVTPGTKFESTDGRELSPDGSLDISTTYRKDASWFFNGQKHELEYNNTAISLAIELALGNIKTVADCDNLEEDGYFYPQFNDARNLKDLKRSYIPDLERFCEENGYVLTAQQEAILAKADAMTKKTVNDYEADNAVMDEVHAMLVEIGVYEADAEPGFFDKAMSVGLGGLNALVYMFFGAKGFFDVLFPVTAQ
ncbi:MAG: hypothetical protein IKL10_00915 [Clostridia bacterium]|nr:hypothetical protein [Clostridia bacterium]